MVSRTKRIAKDVGLVAFCYLAVGMKIVGDTHKTTVGRFFKSDQAR
jgi:hypothetical protein